MSILHKTTRKLPERNLLFVAPRGHATDFESLLSAYHDRGIRVQIAVYDSGLPDAATLTTMCAGVDAVLLAGSARYSPRTALPGPFLINGAAHAIPAAWFPIKNSLAARRFSDLAARVQKRRSEHPSVGLLSQWHPKYLRLSGRMAELLQPPIETYRWTGDVISRESVVTALGSGLGLALYLGHGRPIGWVGYYGLRSRHFESFTGEPVGSVLSLCCRTASRRRTGISFSETLPLLGVTASSFGAVMETKHTDNTRWALRICECLCLGVDTIGELIVRAAPPNTGASAPYRLIGDPLAPLNGPLGGARRAAAVITYP